MVFRFLFWVLWPEMKTRKTWKFYKNTIILKYGNIASKKVRMLFKILSNRKWFSHIANRVASIYFLRAPDPSRFLKSRSFLFTSVLTLEKVGFSSKNNLEKHLKYIDSKIKIFNFIQVFFVKRFPFNTKPCK